MAVNGISMATSLETKSFNLNLSDEENNDGMPRIINTISLQGQEGLSFDQEQDNDDLGLLYPSCEIKEEHHLEDERNKNGAVNVKENGQVSDTKRNEEEGKNLKKEKKRLKLTQMPLSFKFENGPRSKPSTSRFSDFYNVVDARKLALQENLFKTKELFDTFLRVCQDQENSEQMERVVDKLSRAYDKARKEFLGSLEFQNILESETEKVNTSNTKPWLNLKLVLDEMKHNKVHASPKMKLGDSEDSQNDLGEGEDEPIIECPKKRRHLKKLEKTLRAINLKIKKLEEKEVDLDDDDSAYIKLDRYRAQFTKIYNKVCEIKGKLPDADRPYLRKVSFAGTTYPHINRCIERYYNKHREFPDFQDIKKLVTIANEQENIPMPPVKVHQMAAAAFKEFGEMLKRLRQYDDYDVIISYLDQQVDPARDDEQLREELTKNALLFKKREQEVIDKFAEQDGGFLSGSDSNTSKQVKKKKKIILTSPRKPPSKSVKRHLSSSESSDEEESVAKTVKKPKPGPSLSSDSSSSESETEKTEKKAPTVTAKGKTLIGKSRIVKKGLKPNAPKKDQMPKPVISSDEEESPPKDTKDSFTNYLGLKVTPLKAKTKEPEIKVESEEEITCVQEIRKSPVNTPVTKRTNNIYSSDSDDSVKSKPSSTAKIDDKKSSQSNSNVRNRNKPTKQTAKINVSKAKDSCSDSEPIPVEKPQSKTVIKNKQTSNVSVLQKRSRAISVNNSDESSEDRTSDEDSDVSEKKSMSDLELSTGTKDLSSDSSDDNGEDKGKKDSDADDSIVILSEEIVPEPQKKPRKNSPVRTNLSPDSSDSDEVCIVSQESESTRMVAPRRTNVEEKPSNRTPQRSLSLTANAARTPPMKRTLGPASSTPKQKKPMMKRIVSTQAAREIVSRPPKRPSSSSSTSSTNSQKQQTITQFINGAARKTTAPHISRVCRPTTNPEPIPLIELD